MLFNFYPFSDFNLVDDDKIYKLNFNLKRIPNTKNIALIAGNIAPNNSEIFWKFIDHISRIFDYAIFVPSSLEFYNSSYIETIDNLTYNFSTNYPNVFLLNNDCIYFNDVLIIGSWFFCNDIYDEEHIKTILGFTENIQRSFYNRSKNYLFDVFSKVNKEKLTKIIVVCNKPPKKSHSEILKNHEIIWIHGGNKKVGTFKAYNSDIISNQIGSMKEPNQRYNHRFMFN